MPLIKRRPKRIDPHQNKKGRWENKEDRFFRNGEPTDIIGLIKIRGEDYVLVQWGQIGKVYIPYQFMRDNFGELVLDYYQTRSRFKRY